MKFNRSAAVEQGTDIPGFQDGHFIQYIADNVDHNAVTIDGLNTFHGMGMIATMTPAGKNTKRVPRVDVSAKDISAVGTVSIVPFMPIAHGMESLAYTKLSYNDVVDQTSLVDDLWRLSLSLRSPRPGWSGMMQTVHKGNHPGKASTCFLPMIDMEPGNMTCINSTLHFICQHASRYDVKPIITFDQPLWWKAMMIIESEPVHSSLHSIVLRLGGFHTVMSFIGSIGHLMDGSGLKELLETIYASNTVTHMLTGKAVQRALRGLSLVDSALNAVLVAEEFHTKPPFLAKDQEPGMAPTDDDNTEGDVDLDLQVVGNLYDSLMSGEKTVDDVCQSEELVRVVARLERKRQSMKDMRTANLWLQFMDMMSILRKFLKAERKGIWDLHIQAMRDMLPYLAASGHNLYTKSLHVYLQKMTKLQDTHPDVFNQFNEGLHVVRRSDRFWAGLSPDLVIEQVLMRSMKTSGGLTRGRGMTEGQRQVWVMSHPVCSEVNYAMQELTQVNFSTSDQHKDLTKARQAKDTDDSRELFEYLNIRNPFNANPCLRSIATGVNAASTVNVDRAKCIGDNILNSMSGKLIQEHTLKRKDQAVTLGVSHTKKDDSAIEIDPQLLFQRLVSAGTQSDSLSDLFEYELCSYPPALFEARHVMRPANKPALADALWDLLPEDVNEPTVPCHYILDGGSLLHKIPWQHGVTYGSICTQYTTYVTRKYNNATVVFDGYMEKGTTKDCTHQRRTGGKTGATVDVTSDMIMKSKKADFLSNERNKQRFISLLSDRLTEAGCETHHAKGDADTLIVQKTIVFKQGQDHPSWRRH